MIVSVHSLNKMVRIAARALVYRGLAQFAVKLLWIWAGICRSVTEWTTTVSTQVSDSLVRLTVFVAAAMYGLMGTSVGLAQDESDSSGSRPAPYDYSCGPNTLYLLLKCRGRSVSLGELKEQLTPSEEGQVSMAQMRNAAAAFGTSLVGRRVTPQEVLELKTPFILLEGAVGHGGHGHYLFIRPLAPHTGIQTIDPPYKPQIVTAVELASYQGPPLPVLIPTQEGTAGLRLLLTVALGALVAGTAAMAFAANRRLARQGR